MAHILVVDDEMGIRELLSEILTDEGHDVALAENAAAARQYCSQQQPDLVLLDIWMPDTDGISLLKEWSSAGALNMPVVMMSGHGTIDSAVEATRVGAVDFLEKPIALQKLLTTVKSALSYDLKPVKVPATLDLFASSPLMKEVKKRLQQTAASSCTLLLKGAPPIMAEVCARTLQAVRTPWLDFASISGPLTQDMMSNITGGTLFVSDLQSLGKLQQKNLAFAVERLERFRLRLIVAMVPPINCLCEAGWDSTLVNRLSEVWVAMPLLSMNQDEVPEIAASLLKILVDRQQVPVRQFSVGALSSLKRHAWDGEWTELLASVRNLAIACLQDEISEEDVVQSLQLDDSDDNTVPALPFFEQPLREAREAFERLYFEHHLRESGGNMTRVAERSGLERTHLYRKLKQLGITFGRRNEESEVSSS